MSVCEHDWYCPGYGPRHDLGLSYSQWLEIAPPVDEVANDDE